LRICPAAKARASESEPDGAWQAGDDPARRGMGIAVTVMLFRLQEGRLRRISEDSSIHKRVWDAGVFVPVLAR